MDSTAIDIGKQLFDANIRVTQLTEFGIRIRELLSGKAEPPPEGARFDVAFEGTLAGSGLKGSIVGVDYLRIHAGGRFELHVHAVIRTNDGATLAYSTEGCALLNKGGSIVSFRQYAKLHTWYKPYFWANCLSVIVIGTTDLGKLEIHVKGYAPKNLVPFPAQGGRGVEPDR